MDSDFSILNYLSTLLEAENSTTSVHALCSEKLTVVDPLWEMVDPNPDIQALFNEFNQKFFWGEMPQLEVKWSNRMTDTIGITRCRRSTGKCKILLSKPILDLLPRKDTVETLLHEMIHAYFFVMDLDDDDDHGRRFRRFMRYIDRKGGTKLKIEHEFDEEVEALKRHWWICDGPCGKLEKRATNRTPDTKAHKRKCGGKFVKISEPDQPLTKKRRTV